MYKVLIVDDEYFIRYGLENTINWNEYGIEVVDSAKDGQAALECIKRSKPDIIITDVKMPHMNGIELLKEIRENYHDIKVIVISGYNEFDYVKESLKYGVENYILKPIDEEELSQTLLNTLDKIEKQENKSTEAIDEISFIRENVLWRFTNNSISIKEAKERLEFLNIDITAKSYLIGIIKIIENRKNTSNNKIVNLVDKIINNEIKNYIFCDLEGNILLLFCKGLEDKYVQIEKIFMKIISCINTQLDIDVFVTLGSEEDEIKGINESYKKAHKLQNYSYIYPVNTRISYPKLLDNNKKLYNIYKIKFQELKEHIACGNKKGVSDFFEIMTNKIMSAKIGSVTIDYVRSLMIQLLAMLVSIIKEKKLKEERQIVNTDNLYEKLFGQKRIEDSLKWLEDISNSIIDEIKKENQKPKTIIEEIISYLNNNYDKSISLQYIAEMYYLNPSYLGQIFKKETEKLFSDYLNELRIEKATELLKETNMKACQIADKVGYSSPDYFYKVFMKYTGVYPVEYRNNKKMLGVDK